MEITKSLSMKNIIRVSRLAILVLVGMILILSASLSSIYAQGNASNRDKLAYVSNDNHLILYDPHDHSETILLEDVRSFRLGRDGRIAFTRSYTNDPALYVFDPTMPDLAPIDVSQNPTVESYPLAWSPDGRYLAFALYQESSDYSISDHSIYVWDGEASTNITPDNGLDTAKRFYVDWSHDGRLAFTVIYGWSTVDIPAEIYVWDGNSTMNLSQNPEGEDWRVRWGMSGQLMFASYRDEGNGFYVWDGVSFKDGSPDVDSFIRLAPELHPNYAGWMGDSIVGFTVYPESSPSDTKEIVLWNLESESVVERFPVSSENAWSWLAEGGEVVLSSHLASGLPSYYLDVESTDGEILFSTHTGEFSWSADGYLAYCEFDEELGWILSVWDGNETWAVARVSYRPVQWQRGGSSFSCNNG
ncbi:WD40 repeat domain-containing protein [Aggregatilinea lenta]|uniref:WD40 repeat domain-containing protein n=1 Tax=Aggregatilinea lenta TaxID=913108 RepID=UPI000E5A436D|nr:WD40 repeat domain-containing protein [Aggregatilinea lenta]